MAQKTGSDARAPDEAVRQGGIPPGAIVTGGQDAGPGLWVRLGVLLALAAVGAGAVLWWSRDPEVAPPADAGAPSPRTPDPAAAPPLVVFRDVTESSGVDFVHQSGAEGLKLLPETMGGGCAFVDVESDGDADLILVNGCFWPGSEREGERPTQALYVNDGSGRFANRTQAAGLDATFYGMGAACADTDADGDPDAFFTAVGPCRWFANDGGEFTERDVGVAGAPDAWSTCACFFDSDRDGDLDLYVGNYVRWSRAIDLELDFQLTGLGRAYGPPNNFDGTQPCLYRNDGSGRFTDEAGAAGLFVTNVATGVPVGKALGVRACDIDSDGDLDLSVANDTVANFLYRNKGDGTFEERGRELGLDLDHEGRATGAMGIDAAWFRNDASIGIAIGNFANEMTSFYVTQGSGELWADEASRIGIGAPTRKFLKFGTLFLDYDLDGRQDLLQVNGHIENEINRVQKSQTYEQAAQLFWNAGPDAPRTFVEVDGATTGDLSDPIVGRGGASADFDGDGDLDILMTQVGARPLLLRNEQALGQHWLRLHLVGAGENREAIGARVAVRIGDSLQTQDVMPFKSYLSQCELPLTFGLGTAARADEVTVTWPDGDEQSLGALDGGQLHVVEEAR